MAYCNWKNTSKINLKYHDTEWGVPIFNDKKLFEFLMLEVLQCGLSWNIIINKRNIFKTCFDDFDFNLVSKYTNKDVTRIFNSPQMIKSVKKIEAIINNAKCFIKIRKEFGTFSKYIWGFSDNKTILYKNHSKGYIPVSNDLSIKISKDLKKRGFKFLGEVTVYSYLQAAGIVNDHDKNCKRYQYINTKYDTIILTPSDEKNVQYFGE